ncbi:MAG: acyltransferase family protein [Lachnospiraceae bacterium]|nr:acyltransferase family protein [Lachnospiraceae bacterium]
MDSKRKIPGLDILRIIACISVYSMHYCAMELEESKEAIATFRESAWAKSIFGLFWNGEATVVFFVMAGFFITYRRYNSEEDIVRTCIYRCLNILVPTLIVIFFTAGVTFILKFVNMSDMFSVVDIIKDVVKLIIGLPGDKHIHYAYPLWFQHYIFIGYLAGYTFVYIFRRDNRIKYITYLIVLLYTLVNSEYMYMIFFGMLAGELCTGRYKNTVSRIFKNNKICYMMLFAMLSILAAVFDINYDSPIIYGPSVFIISVILVLFFCISMNDYQEGKTNIRNKRIYYIINRLSADSYSCYLIHFFIFCSVMRIIYKITLKFSFFWVNQAAGCIILYIVMTVVLWLFGDLFHQFVLRPLNKLYDFIWRKISKVYL